MPPTIVPTDWGKLTVPKLKAKLLSRGVKLTGPRRKADFVNKLEELETLPIVIAWNWEIMRLRQVPRT